MKRRSAISVNQTQPPNQNQNMNTHIKRIVVLLFVTALLAVVGTGCNTAHGFGKDVEKVGDKIQEGTN